MNLSESYTNRLKALAGILTEDVISQKQPQPEWIAELKAFFDSLDIHTTVQPAHSHKDKFYDWMISVDHLKNDEDLHYGDFDSGFGVENINGAFIVKSFFTGYEIEPELKVVFKSAKLGNIKNYFTSILEKNSFEKKSEIDREMQVNNDIYKKNNLPPIKAALEKFAEYGARDFKVIFKSSPSVIIKNKAIKDLVNELSPEQANQVREIIVNVQKI